MDLFHIHIVEFAFPAYGIWKTQRGNINPLPNPTHTGSPLLLLLSPTSIGANWQLTEIVRLYAE